jgi:hypothetical protein
MVGLVCTGLDELLDGVASLEDYLCQCSPLLFNEIFMFGLVCTGLDELLDGVASLEDYLSQSTLVI